MFNDHAALLQNLRDAGAPESEITFFNMLLKNGTYPEQILFLRKQRTVLLDNLHSNKRCLDCLDYLMYTMKKKNDVGE